MYKKRVLKNFSWCYSFHLLIKEVKSKNKQHRCENAALKNYRRMYTLQRPLCPFTFSHTFQVPPPLLEHI